jgi:RNA polymerase sigma-70 factor, ECF subfamily
MTDRPHVGHSTGVNALAAAEARLPPPAFDTVYAEHFAFVWRTLRRFGVRESHLDDAAQETWVVVHRRLASFEGRSSLRTWLVGIAVRVASDHRRWRRRKDPHDPMPDDPPFAAPGVSPEGAAERAQAARLLDALLDTIPEERRAVFVLTELEGMSAPEVSEALGVPLNTVYSRLRVARSEFETAASRLRGAKR